MRNRTDKRILLIKLLLERGEDGNYRYGQHDINRLTKMSRNTIKKVADEFGRTFESHGTDIRSPIWMCINCKGFFRRPPAKVKSGSIACSNECKASWQSKTKSTTISNFERWLNNWSYNEKWKQEMLDNAGHMCQISERTDNLEVYHVMEERHRTQPDLAFRLDSGLVLNTEVRNELFDIMLNRVTFDEASEQLKVKYGRQSLLRQC